MTSTVALVTVTVIVAMVVTTLWSVLLRLPRNQIVGMLTMLLLTWAIFMIVQGPHPQPMVH